MTARGGRSHADTKHHCRSALVVTAGLLALVTGGARRPRGVGRAGPMPVPH